MPTPTHSPSQAVQTAATPSPTQPAKARRAPARIITRLLILAIVLYLIYLIVAAFMQETFYFPRYLTRSTLTESTYPANAQSIWIEPSPGIRVEAILSIPATATAEAPAPLVVFTHGNAELIDDNLAIVGFYQSLGYAVLMPEYRGYGRSAGSPTQHNITNDVIAFIEQAAQYDEIAQSPIIYHGRSIGGGIAGSVAAQRPPDALIIESSFTSLRAMMGQYGVPAFIARNHMDTNATITNLDIPILIIHGDNDTLIPVKHAHHNAATAKDPTLVIIEGCGHNDIFPTDPRFQNACKGFLARVQAKHTEPETTEETADSTGEPSP